MGGFYVPTSIGPHVTPTVWRSSFAEDITTHLVSSKNAQGTLTNSDLELAAIITGAATIAQSAPSPHQHIFIATDNTPVLAWISKGSTSSAAAPAFLLRQLAQHCHAHAFTVQAVFTPDDTNTIADFCSHAFHLLDDDFLTQLNLRFPMQPSWKLATPSADLIFAMSSALIRRSPTKDYLTPAPLPMSRLGTSGPTTADLSTVTPTYPTYRTPSQPSKSLPIATAWESLLPIVLKSVLEQWKELFVPWDRGLPHWDALTHGSSHQVSLTSGSLDNFRPIEKRTHHPIELSQYPSRSSPMPPTSVTNLTFPKPMPSLTCSYWASSSFSTQGSMPLPITQTPPHFDSPMSTYSSTPDCEDNLYDPQLDQGNEEVIRVALLTFGLKR
jgi:hypothetical protein